MKRIAIIGGLLLIAAIIVPTLSHANAPPGQCVLITQEFNSPANLSIAPATISPVDVPYTVMVSECVISSDFEVAEIYQARTFVQLNSQYPGAVTEYPLRTCISGRDANCQNKPLLVYPLKTYGLHQRCGNDQFCTQHGLPDFLAIKRME